MHRYYNRINELKQTGDSDLQLATPPSEDGSTERLALQEEFGLLTAHTVEELQVGSRRTYYEHGEKVGERLPHQLQRKAASQPFQRGRTSAEQPV